MKVFALRFRELRIEKGLTQKEIAVFLKTTNKKISFWETDFTDPSLEEVVETAAETVENAVEIEPLFEEHVDFETFSKSDFRAVKVKACEAVKKSKKLLQFFHQRIGSWSCCSQKAVISGVFLIVCLDEVTDVDFVLPYILFKSVPILVFHSYLLIRIYKKLSYYM